MVKKQMESELDEFDVPEEEQEEPKEIEEEIEDIQPIEKEESKEDILERRIIKIEKVLNIIPKWVKKNSDEIKRLDENFQRLLEDKE